MRNKTILVGITSILLISCTELNTVLDSVNKNIKPEFRTVSATKICDDFSENEILASKKWKGSYVSMKAKIESIYKDAWDSKNITLKINQKVNILAELNKSSNVDKLKKGNRVNVKGKISNVMHTGHCNILLDDSFISK